MTMLTKRHRDLARTYFDMRPADPMAGIIDARIADRYILWAEMVRQTADVLFVRPKYDSHEPVTRPMRQWLEFTNLARYGKP